MVKKKVPDWLNNSLWSTTTTPPPPSPDDDRLQRYVAPKPVTAAAATEPPGPDAAPPPPAPTHAPAPAPVPVPPRDVVSVQQEPPKPQVIVNDNKNSNSDRNDDENGSFVQPQLMSELSKKMINVREMRRIAMQGIPDGAGIRSTVWKLLLGYLPPDRGLWASELAKKRSQYKHFKDDLLMNPSVRNHEEAGKIHDLRE